MPLKNIEIDTKSREWVKEYADMFDGQPWSYYLADIIGSAVATAISFYFNFPKITSKMYKFMVSWNSPGFDEYDLQRLDKVHSNQKSNKKGQSVRGRGLRCVIENLLKGINIKEEEGYEEKCTRFLSRSKDYKNGEITAVMFCQGMQWDYRKATQEEEQKFITHMREKHDDEYGIMAEFRTNKDKAREIFTQTKINFEKKKPEVEPRIIKDIKLILNRRMVNENGSPGEVSLSINDKECISCARLIHSNPKQRRQRYICLRATIGKRKLRTQRAHPVFCLRLSDNSLKRIQQLREENSDMRHLEDIKKYINFYSGKGREKKMNCAKRKYLDGEDGWMMDEVKNFEPVTTDFGNGIWKERELELRFSVGPPPAKESSGEYLKYGSGKDAACGIFMYHNNTIVNLKGLRKLKGLTVGSENRFRDDAAHFTPAQVPCVEIEEMNIKLGDSKIFTTKAVKAASVQFKQSDTFYIALIHFINCFLQHHMYFRTRSEKDIEAQKQKKEREKSEKAAQKNETDKRENAARQRKKQQQQQKQREQRLKNQMLAKKASSQKNKAESEEEEKSTSDTADNAPLLITTTPPITLNIVEKISEKDDNEETIRAVVKKEIESLQEKSDEEIESLQEKSDEESDTNSDKLGSLYAYRLPSWEKELGAPLWKCGSTTNEVNRARAFQHHHPLESIEFEIIAKNVPNVKRTEQHYWHPLLKNHRLKDYCKKMGEICHTTGIEYFVTDLETIRQAGKLATKHSLENEKVINSQFSSSKN